jgi:hypothetical protein
VLAFTTNLPLAAVAAAASGGDAATYPHGNYLHYEKEEGRASSSKGQLKTWCFRAGSKDTPYVEYRRAVEEFWAGSTSSATYMFHLSSRGMYCL